MSAALCTAQPSSSECPHSNNSSSPHNHSLHLSDVAASILSQLLPTPSTLSLTLRSTRYVDAAPHQHHSTPGREPAPRALHAHRRRPLIACTTACGRTCSGQEGRRGVAQGSRVSARGADYGGLHGGTRRGVYTPPTPLPHQREGERGAEALWIAIYDTGSHQERGTGRERECVCAREWMEPTRPSPPRTSPPHYSYMRWH